MKPRRLVRRPLLASFALIMPLAFLAAGGFESEASVHARVGSVLATLTVDCWRKCTWNCQDPDYHETTGSGTTAEGPYHDCGYNTLGCEWHEENCGGGPTRGGIAELEKLIPSLDGEGIRYLVESTEAFTLNFDRQAIQVLGCGEDVVLSVHLTPMQELDLAVDE
jgi:hypothetical protein